MGTSRLFMPLLTELGGLGDGFCYKYVAPNGAPALERRLFNKATSNLNQALAFPRKTAASGMDAISAPTLNSLCIHF